MTAPHLNGKSLRPSRWLSIIKNNFHYGGFIVRMRRQIVLILALALAPANTAATLAATPSGAQAPARAAIPYFAEPAVSPDRSEIAFVSGGDIWAVPAGGGEARLLISHPANEGRPMYSPDGKRLAFVSNRTGAGDVYILTFATGDVQRLTFD